MNWLDIVLGIFLFLTAVSGLMRGLLSTLIPLIGLIIGVLVAGHYYTGLAHGLFRSHTEAAYIAAFVVIVLLFLIAAWIVTAVLHGLLKVVLLDWVNHLAGFLAGAVLRGIMAGAVLSVLLKYDIGLRSCRLSGREIPYGAFIPAGRFRPGQTVLSKMTLRQMP